MPITELITIELGTAIAKSILKLWLKDSTLAQDTSSSLVDIFKAWTSDKVAQRRGERQFETIGEKVAESLLPLFEIEGARLDENGRNAVALAVVEAFNRAKLTNELLAERNLEPIMLAKHIVTTNPGATRDFSMAETAFYERIIDESCAYIVDIATQLPAFTEHTFAEILKREDKLIITANQILQEVRRMSEHIGPTEAGLFEKDYRQAVVRKLDELQLFGTDVSTANRRHRLSVAYITLSVNQNLQSFSDNEDITSPGLDQAIDDSQNDAVRDSLPVDMALAQSHRLLIRGLAGSGKTTLLQWVAVKSAQRSFDGELAGWNDMLPFYIRLRHFVQSALPRPEAFPEFVASAILGTMPGGWVHTQLKSGRAIVLVDGLDEVSSIRRETVRSWLKELVETYPKARYLVTTRPHAAEEGWMDNDGFSDTELQPMELSDIYSFIDHWHKAVREALNEDEERAELDSLADHLKGNVKRNRSLRNLATNPLLCAMLCALNRDRRRQLPEDRIELYEACCSLLLERRDKERSIELTDYPALNYRQKRLLLEDMAYWMIKNNWSEVALEHVEERFERKLKDMPGISQDREITGADVHRLFVERSGMIREPIIGEIDFTHRTFQEFLAAKAASDEMDTGVLVANGHNDQWREVIILACGLASNTMREEIIKGLIARGDTEQENRYQLHLLAVSCLETSVALGQETKNEVEKRLGQLVPPKNMTDAKALAAAGELVVKYLVKKVKYPIPTTAACVRTLSLIGTEAALEALEGYANDTRSKVYDELLKAWESFDREDYAKRVLSQTLRKRTELHLERHSSLEGMQYLTALTSLDLRNCPQLSDLAPLASLITLTSLRLHSCPQVKDISALIELRNLETIISGRHDKFTIPQNIKGNVYIF
jgi:hypothetical protein